ncbi:hypothetical protein EBU58_13895, partial [bacterium]|nr:hypothetical protein [bacterium]
MAVLAGGFSAAWSVEADEQEVAVARLKQGVGLLASEAMQGRGPGSAGINQAADWVAEEFAALGLVAPQAASV